MAWRTALIAAVWLLAPSAAPAGTPPDVRTLIKQLGSEKYAERDAASKTLDKLGAAGLPIDPPLSLRLVMAVPRSVSVNVPFTLRNKRAP